MTATSPWMAKMPDWEAEARHNLAQWDRWHSSDRKENHAVDVQQWLGKANGRSGGEGSRTPDLCRAKAALYH